MTRPQAERAVAPAGAGTEIAVLAAAAMASVQPERTNQRKEADVADLRPRARPRAERAEAPAGTATEVAVLAAATMLAVQPELSKPPEKAGPYGEVSTGSLLPATTVAVGETVAEPELVTDAGVQVRFESDVRPMSRRGTFATSETPADSMVQVSRQITRVHFDADMRPYARPRHPLADYTVTLAAVAVSATPGAPEPKARPAGFKDLFKRKQSYSSKGAVCGVNAIKGAPIKTFGNPSRGCGIANPVRVIEVSGVRLSTPATIDCTTAKSLNSWVAQSVKPAVGRRGGGVSQIKIAASYTCRNRNNKAAGKLSEHAKGHAVDISGFVLKDGSQITVLKGWRSKSDSTMLKQVHRAACGPFGTVLGPNADRYHQDHFHFDTARYRSGTYCR